MEQVVAFVGPTASGKSSLADNLALHLKSEVVSVDAMQVYRGMDIGTAKVPVDERKVPLHMVDVVDINESYSAELFQKQAREVCESLITQGKLPILCGGTGLYLNAVIDEMEFPKGTIDSSKRSEYTKLAEEQGGQFVHDLLAQKDPKSAEIIHPNNVRRTIRALELLDEGKSYHKVHEGLYKRKPHFDPTIFGLMWPREILYERINKRVDIMFEQGLVDEVRRLCEGGLEGQLTSKQAIGYKEILDAFAGNITLDEAKELICQRSRQYAKRQMTWFRKDERIIWIDMDKIKTEENAFSFVLQHLPQTTR